MLNDRTRFMADNVGHAGRSYWSLVLYESYETHSECLVWRVASEFE